MRKWIPDRKIVAGGLAGVAAWLVVMGLGEVGVPVSMEAATAIVGVAVTAFGYIVPDSVERVLEKADDILVEFGEEDDAEA